jgi:D-galactarolactone isomerase
MIAGACDCHMHVYGPLARYPATATPPAGAEVADYRALQARLGLERVVVVQPTVYGTDNRCTLDATRALGPEARCVVVVPSEVSATDLEALDRQGARGVRFHMLPGGALRWDDLEPLAARVAPLGWHVQLQMPGSALGEIAARLKALPLPVVIDHIGRFEGGTTVDAPAFRVLLGLLETGAAWVKLSAPYWSSPAGDPYDDVAPLVRKLVEVAPERLVFATNWPHPSIEGAKPDDGRLRDLITGWLPDAATCRAVLRDNAAKLYGFTRGGS